MTPKEQEAVAARIRETLAERGMSQSQLARAIEVTPVTVWKYLNGIVNPENKLRAIARALGAAVIVVHHSTKPNADGKTSARGSSALRGWADHELVVSETDDAGTVSIAHEKDRERAKERPRHVTWTFTDESIVMTIKLTTDEAIAETSAKRNAAWLLGRLAEEGRPLKSKELRGKMSPATQGALIVELERAGKLHRTEGTYLDAVGRKRTCEVLVLGPKPSGDTSLSPDTLSPDEEDEG